MKSTGGERSRKATLAAGQDVQDSIDQWPFLLDFLAVFAFAALCAESHIAESRRIESAFVLSIAIPGFFAGFVSTPYPSESDNTPALAALSLFDRFDEHAAIATATGTAPISFNHCIVAPPECAIHARFNSETIKQALCCDASREPDECIS